MEKEDSYSLSGNGFLNGAENYPFHKAIVHEQQRMKTRGGGEVGD